MTEWPEEELIEQGIVPPVGRGSSGSLQSPIMDSPLTVLANVAGSVDSSNLVNLDSSTGRSSSPSGRRFLFPDAVSSSDHSMPNSRDQMPQLTTAGNTIRQSLARNLNSVRNQSVETTPSTGRTYGPPPSPEILIRSPQISEWCLIGHYEQLRQTLANLLDSFEDVRFTGVQLEQAKAAERGLKRAPMHPKDPRTKFWDGYQNESAVIIDEFRGGIDIAHLLRWLDRYPVRVEIKGSSTTLLADSFWITSNLSPFQWYSDADPMTVEALMRRLNIIEFN